MRTGSATLCAAAATRTTAKANAIVQVWMSTVTSKVMGFSNAPCRPTAAPAARGGTASAAFRLNSRKTVLKRTALVKPLSRATAGMSRSVLRSRFIARARCMRRISSSRLRPSSRRNRRSRLRRLVETCCMTSSTLIGLAAFSRMKRAAATTSGSSIASTSVECRVTTPSGGSSTGAAGVGFPCIKLRKQLGGHVADAQRIGRDARERRADHLRQQHVVVHAEDRDVFRHADADLAAGVDRVPRVAVVAREDARTASSARRPTRPARCPRPPPCCTGTRRPRRRRRTSCSAPATSRSSGARRTRTGGSRGRAE